MGPPHIQPSVLSLCVQKPRMSLGHGPSLRAGHGPRLKEVPKSSRHVNKLQNGQGCRGSVRKR